MYREKYLWPEHYLDLPDSEVVQVYPRNHVKIVVVGGETNNFSQAWKFAYPTLMSVDRYK
jgi:hypothetical protein